MICKILGKSKGRCSFQDARVESFLIDVLIDIVFTIVSNASFIHQWWHLSLASAIDTLKIEDKSVSSELTKSIKSNLSAQFACMHVDVPMLVAFDASPAIGRVPL